ncbi:response regulator [Enterococcus sp. HY326]|uniref:response regulator n=1 Tax=Enterococcus sp. HY326 TaxID=2971265 RepID=UPI0022400292|nr:response regulator [Enterococcus sp. HY326]
MYKVFIVEDEHLIRESLRQQVNDLAKKLPIEYLDEAADGELALSSILDLRPDIILTDIKMPFMDGLTFAKEARKLLPYVRLIFISGFDDFEYAKTAIQVQADDYLLKPIKSGELEEALSKAVKNLDQQKKQLEGPSTDSVIKIESQKNLLLNNLLSGTIAISDVVKQIEPFQKSLVGKKINVMLISNRDEHFLGDYTQYAEKLNFLYQTDPQIFFSSLSSRFIKLLIFDSNEKTILEKSYQVAQTLINELEVGSDNLVVATGPIVERISDLPRSYRKAKDMLDSYGLIRVEKIMSYEDNLKEGELSPTNPFKIDLSQRLADLTEKEIPNFIAELSQDQETVERTRMFRFFILIELKGLIYRNENIDPDEIDIELDNIELLTTAPNNQQAFQGVLANLLPQLLAKKGNPMMQKYQSVIQQALNYIKENFADPNISLKSVAEVVNLSAAHFSTIFSQSTGSTFIEYLTNQRIEKAKQLLLTTDLRLSDIAFEIGYNDPNYFSFLFKKKVEMSPKDYRQSNLAS